MQRTEHSTTEKHAQIHKLALKKFGLRLPSYMLAS